MNSRSKRHTTAHDRRKQSLYFPESVLAQIVREADRLDRSMSWVVQRCVRYGIDRVAALPSMADVEEAAE